MHVRSLHSSACACEDVVLVLSPWHALCCWRQEALMLASVSKRSLTLPGLKSDWEIDPDELVIERFPDGTEWELGSGASARVRWANYHSVDTNSRAH